jgi:hypothetical protein
MDRASPAAGMASLGCLAVAGWASRPDQGRTRTGPSAAYHQEPDFDDVEARYRDVQSSLATEGRTTAGQCAKAEYGDLRAHGDRWDESTIRDRGSQLAELIIDIWPGPSTLLEAIASRA